MGMSIPYEERGRRRQKARTRAALVEAARELLGEGTTPTVEQAAERAQIARTTAYRYFGNQKALLASTYPELDHTSLLGVDPPSDTVERLKIVIERFTEQVVGHEAELRATLRLALDPELANRERLPLRQGRGIRWIEEALAPLSESITESEISRLVLAIRTTIGIEALIWLTDVGGLTRGEAVATMRWSAEALLRTALQTTTEGSG